MSGGVRPASRNICSSAACAARFFGRQRHLVPGEREPIARQRSGLAGDEVAPARGRRPAPRRGRTRARALPRAADRPTAAGGVMRSSGLQQPCRRDLAAPPCATSRSPIAARLPPPHETVRCRRCRVRPTGPRATAAARRGKPGGATLFDERLHRRIRVARFVGVEAPEPCQPGAVRIARTRRCGSSTTPPPMVTGGE